MESNEPLLRYKWGNEEWVQCKVFSVECKRRAFRITYAMYDHKYAGSYLLWHQDNFLEEREKTFCMKWDDDDIGLVCVWEFTATLYSTSFYFSLKKVWKWVLY